MTDWCEQEQTRGITIKAAAITTHWRDTVTGAEAQINLISMPSHIGFTADVQQSLPALDDDPVIYGGAPSDKPR